MLQRVYNAFYSSPIGYIGISATSAGVTIIDFLEEKPLIENTTSEWIEKTLLQMEEYFNGNRKIFELLYDAKGTDFQKCVWEELALIPFGKTKSYLDIAVSLGDRNKIRAVGGANSRNPLAIVVPCHRVISHNGTLTGYAGGLWRKKWLLQFEMGQTDNALFMIK